MAIFFARQELASGQLQDQRLLSGGIARNSKLCTLLTTVNLADAALDGTAIAVQQFQLGQAQQIARQLARPDKRRPVLSRSRVPASAGSLKCRKLP